ncbi:MAG: hypothetical protein ABSA75_00585 [Candidatus Bathyarchaeia archaeon]
MTKETSSDLSSTVVVIGGKKTTIGEVQKSYATVSFLSKLSAMKVVQVLLTAKEPMTREQIAEQAKLSTGYTIDVLKSLIKYEYVVPFRIGSRKLIFYAMTEKGFEMLANKEKSSSVFK